MKFDQMGMLSSSAPAAVTAGLCSMDDGGAAAALAAGGGDPPAGDPPAGDPPADPPAGDPPAGDPPAGDPEWLEQFSAEGGDADNPANRDWLKAKGFKTPDDLAKSYREAEKAVRNKGSLTVPGDDAKPEEVEAFHKAIGRPETPDGYEFKLPEGAEMDERLVGGAREAAFKAGVPKAGFEAIAEAIVQSQMDQLTEMKTAEDGNFGEWKKAQGEQVSQKIADANSAMRALGLNQADVAAMQKGFYMTSGKPGSAKVMDMLAKLGAGMAEDALMGGGSSKRFGITGAEAQKEIDQLTVDQEFSSKLAAKDPAAVARWTRLNEAVAADRDRATKAASAA